ncbi:sugar phosphate isomerase/epimerase [Candidatus Woesearchaeota archaeon]|nr:sugar phosphate isomerase/epimerase [Candidatus Woesearchaeota archaeon]
MQVKNRKMNFGISLTVVLKKDLIGFCRGIEGYLTSINKLIKIKEKYNLSNIEIWSQPPINTGLLLNNKEKIKHILKNHETSFHLPFWEINISAFQENIRKESLKEIKLCMDLCNYLGIKKAVLHPGTFNILNQGLEETTLKNFVSSFKELMDYSKNKNITIFVENLQIRDLMFTKPEDFDIVIEKEGFICLDTGHAITNNINPIKFLDRFRDKILHIHFYSNFINQRDQHLPLGEGDFDYKMFISKLKEINYAGNIIFELFSEQDLAKSLNEIKELL